MANREKKNRQGKKKPALLLKKCSRCHEVKDITEFNADRSKKDGFNTRCKECDYECHKIRREKFQKRTDKQLPHITSKRCSKCGETKSVAEFYPVLTNKDGYGDWCKVCCREQKRSYYRKLAMRRKSQILCTTTKRCPTCAKVKPVSEFYKSVGKPNGHAAICRDCSKRSRVHYVSKNTNREFEDIQPTGKKRCWMCKRQLPVSEFNYSRVSLDGLVSHCRKCGKEYKKQHYEANYSNFYNRQVEYRQKHPERRNAFAVIHKATYKGSIIRPDTCSKCGMSGYIVAHHDDYDRPLEVRWLCLSCDRQLHADLKRKKN